MASDDLKMTSNDFIWQRFFFCLVWTGSIQNLENSGWNLEFLICQI